MLLITKKKQTKKSLVIPNYIEMTLGFLTPSLKNPPD